MFRGKNYKESAKLIDKQALYDPKDAFDLVCKASKAKFDETVELHVKLGVDSRHADQQVRGAVVLPNGTGKTVRVCAIAKGPAASAAEAAGAVDELVNEANSKVMAFCAFQLDPLFEHNNLKADGTGIYQEVFDTIDYDGVSGAEVVDVLLDGMESVGYTINA